MPAITGQVAKKAPPRGRASPVLRRHQQTQVSCCNRARPYLDSLARRTGVRGSLPEGRL